MKITLYTTPDSLDPHDTVTDVSSSLVSYRRSVDRELIKHFPDAEIEHVEQDNTCSFRISGVDDQSALDYAQTTIQGVIESVYETGEFWTD